MKALRRWAWPFALFTAIGLLLFSYHYLDDLAHGEQGTMLRRFIEEMTGVYAAAVFMPFVIWFIRRFRWPWQPLGAAAYTLGHTSLMAISRAILFPLAGMGAYDYGNMTFRYPMEASNDILIYAIVIGFVYFFDRSQRAARLQGELAQAKLENLRLQLQPHFLFNTLNAVSAVMYEDVGKADAMLARLSDFLRIVLKTGDAPEVTLAEELEIERMYVDVMKARLENNLQFDVHAAEDARECRVPALLLQPLVENAIRHGMADGRSTLAISIAASRHNGTLEISVRDDGTGLATATPDFGHGLSNVRSRIAHLNRAGAMQVRACEPAGTEVTLSLPAAP